MKDEKLEVFLFNESSVQSHADSASCNWEHFLTRHLYWCDAGIVSQMNSVLSFLLAQFDMQLVSDIFDGSTNATQTC